MWRYLEVTQADIDKAEELRRKNVRGEVMFGLEQTCPIACALGRSFFVRMGDVSANPDRLRVDHERKVYAYHTSETMRRFMKRWDRRWTAKPHRFIIREY